MPRAGRGQATLELALVLPFVAVLFLAVAQVTVVARAQVMLGTAAREAARALAVGQDEQQALAAAVAASGLEPSRLTITVERDGELVAARAAYRDDTTVPIVGRMVGPVDLRASVVMRREE